MYVKAKDFSLSAISKPRFTTNDIHVNDYPQAEVIIQKFSRKLIVNKDGEIEYSDIMEEPRAKPIHEVIDEGDGYLCNAVFCGNCGAEIYSDKCDKCGTIADENTE